MSLGNNQYSAFTDLRKLKHALVLASEGNFTRACSKLCISQSALSRSIQSLETDLGVILFNRSNTKVTTTPAARILLDQAESLLIKANTLIEEASLIREAKRGYLDIGVEAEPNCVWLPEILVHLYREYPQLNITVEKRGSSPIVVGKS